MRFATSPRHAVPLVLASLTAAGAAACGASTTEPTFTQADLMDPQKCQQCHPDHYAEWSTSMHAYAAEDPVFLAMNARAQRETKGAVGTFCVKCHAPMAVLTGATTDGTNLASLPADQKGVTCYFCHSAAKVAGTHDDPITLAKDGVLRSAIEAPVANTAHASGYEALLDRDDPSSSTLCGSCHDIVNGHGVHLERTFEEWKGTVFAQGEVALSCGQCHMAGREGAAATGAGVPQRRLHDHGFPGVDVPLTDFPGAASLQAAAQASLDTTLQAALCVKGNAGAVSLQVVLDNVGAGHGWPSGATQDRRAWVEVIAYAGAQVLYQSGVVADGQSVTALDDPDRWLIRDCIFDGQGNQVHMFWDAQQDESNQLPGPVTIVPTDPRYYLTHVVRTFPRATSTPPLLTTMPDRVTMRVRLVPVGLDVLDDLVTSGDLDAAIKAKMPTYTLAGTDLTWTAAAATIKYPDQGQPVLCVAKGLAAGANTATPAVEHTLCAP